MYVEIQNRRKKNHYYLAHSVRIGQKVRKIRRYLGQNLSLKQLATLKNQAEKHILAQIETFKEITNPIQNLLSSTEIMQLEQIPKQNIILIGHLGKKDWDNFTEQFAYDTNAIEGSSVTLSEVKDIIRENKWPQDVSKAEISETYGVAHAIGHIKKTKTHLSLELMLKLHKFVFSNSKSFAGVFRTRGIEVVVRDSSGQTLHQGAPATRIRPLLNELVAWYNKNKSRYHPVVLAALVHNQFETVHPFQDGNGRVGRLLLNNILIKHGLAPINIELKKRAIYYEALQAYQKRGNIRPMIDLILREYAALKRALR